MELHTTQSPSEIIFSDGQDWIMKLSHDKGVLFNIEDCPNWGPDEFAVAIITILEKRFTVKFERKQPPYLRNECAVEIIHYGDEDI